MKYQDDIYYIDRVLAGDTAAYAQLVAKHKNLVFSIALKILNNREDAEELSQDCFLKAYQALGTFERKSKFSTWLYRIVYNAAISKTRKKKLEFVPMDNYVVHNYSEDDFTMGMEAVDAEEQKKMMDRALDQLTADEGLLITLFYKSENSIEEISNITGLSVSNVKVRLHRIRRKLQEALKMMMEKSVV
jgi:RNA polymerase sigma-70 factor (ECF subfamily)